MRTALLKGRLKPVGLLAVGVYLLVGCIPIPSTQQYMINGKAKPSYLIGKKPADPIELGRIQIQDALDIVCDHVAGEQVGETLLQGKGWQLSPAQIRERVLVTNGGRRYIVPYSRRSGYLVWPICFQALTFTEQDYLALDTDERGVVIAYQTTHDLAKFGVGPDGLRTLNGTRAFEPAKPDRPASLPSTRP